MKRVVGVFVGALLLSALPVFAQAEKPKADAAKPSASKTMSATGTVSAVSADSLTVKGKTAEWTFAVDNATKVAARGASHKTEAMKDEKKSTQITDFVHVGDTVAVNYHDMGDKKHAASVTVRSSAPVK
jgi:predicted aconitase